MSQQCKTQADCFRELARVAKMCEGTATNYTDCIKFNGRPSVCPAEDIEQGCCSPEKVTAAIAIVEGRPVFIGDTLYSTIANVWDTINQHNYDFANYSWNPPTPKEPEIPEGYTRHDGGECPVHGSTEVSVILNRVDSDAWLLEASDFEWRHSMCADTSKIIAYKVIKEATVMVELSVEDAEYLASIARDRLAESYVIDRAGIACRKALEKAK